MGLVGGSSSCVGWADDSQPNKTLDCVGFMLGCQKAATQPTPLNSTTTDTAPYLSNLPIR